MVERVSHRIAVIYGGQTVEIRLSWSVLDAPKHPYTQRLLSAVPIPDPSLRRNREERSLETHAPLPTDPEMALVEIAEGHFVRAEAA